MYFMHFHLVTVAISPEVMNQTQNEGENASFSCQATGEPVPTIIWYFNGVLVNVTNTMKYTISMMSLNTTTINNTLTIISVESSDVGTYTCNATNVVSSDISSGVLTSKYVLFIRELANVMLVHTYMYVLMFFHSVILFALYVDAMYITICFIIITNLSTKLIDMHICIAYL